jgi:hypothetical protein
MVVHCSGKYLKRFEYRFSLKPGEKLLEKNIGTRFQRNYKKNVCPIALAQKEIVYCKYNTIAIEASE